MLRIRRLLLSLALLILAVPLFGVQVYNGAFDYVVDVPEGWEVLDQSNPSMVSFTDPERVAVLQIFVFEGNRFVTAEELSEWMVERFGAESEEAPFRYNEADSRFGSIAFSTGNFVTEGYAVYINSQEYDYAVMATVGEEFYEQYHDTLISSLDSFGLGKRERFVPGPVSQFYYAYPPPSPEEEAIPLGEEEITISYDPAELEATQTLIEREARVLATYTPEGNDRPGNGSGAEGGSPGESAEGERLRGRRDEGVPEWVAAWRRYFRLIYRDNYPRLEELAHALDERFRDEGATYYDVPKRILEWLQGYEYLRTGTLSDFLAPLVAITEQKGDCDSLALIYTILLHHLEYDAVIMVSAEYSHAMVGVDMPGKGARFPFDGREWLVAELTADVEIGMIDQSMSDIGGWIGVRVGPSSLK
ncbi:MAG: hypothetical protein ACLFQZ_11880 [Spirochaetaceae bacterium]